MNLLKDEDMREALRCIRCGACLNHCPVYKKIGGHAYGWVYSGPIGAIVTPPMTNMKVARDLPYASTLCGTCRDVCPVKIDIPKLLLHLRHKVAEGDASEKGSAWMERLFIGQWHKAVRNRKALERRAKLAKLMLKPITRNGKIKKLHAPMVGGWTISRDFPALASQSFADRWKNKLSQNHVNRDK